MKLLEEYLETHPKHILIFDFDRTLVALDIPWNIYRVGIRAVLSDFDRSLVKSYPPNGHIMELVNAVVKECGESARQAVIEYSTYFETRYCKQTVPNRELINFLRQHSPGFQCALWTTNTTATITKWLIHYSLSNYFHQITDRNILNFVKPHPEGFYRIYEPENPKDTYLLIGDSKRDEEAAKSAGIDFFKVEMKVPF